MADAVMTATAAAPGDRHIPLPGLADPYSQLTAPMISQGVVQGVLFAESPERFAFTAEDEWALALIANLLASGLRVAD
jgi:GAF domain-containing protein